MIRRMLGAVSDMLLGPLGMRSVRATRLRERTPGSDRAAGFAARDEEAILRGLLGEMRPPHRFYVDIGASDGVKLSNTLGLALEGWPGVCFEYDPGKVASLAVSYRELPQVRICRAKVTPRNVLGFLGAFAVPSDFGVLSLDIDSYDYFVLEALLAGYRPGVIITEINEKIPPPLCFTVLFDEDHGWDGTHFYGQSICQLERLCASHGYAIAHVEYNNAFLVDARRFRGRALTALESYDRGYRQRSDRRREFPWNRDMEEVLTMAPEQAVAFLRRRFAGYEGRYSLSVGAPVDERRSTEGG